MSNADPAPRSTFAVALLVSFAGVFSLLATVETMADGERGQLLYENHCTICHTSVVHVREKRKAASREDLLAWVRRWQQQLDLKWGNTEIEDVTEYLNERYYGFKSES